MTNIKTKINETVEKTSDKLWNMIIISFIAFAVIANLPGVSSLSQDLRHPPDPEQAQVDPKNEPHQPKTTTELKLTEVLDKPETESKLSQVTGEIKAEAEEAKVEIEPVKAEPVEVKEVIAEADDKEEEPKSDIDSIIQKVAKDEGVNWKLIKTICLTEGCNPKAKNTGCNYIRQAGRTVCENSHGAFQINLRAHGKTVTQAKARDVEFAARWTARRIKGQYGCKLTESGAKNWIGCLSKHQGAKPDLFYIEKITKNGANLGLKF